MLEVHFLDLINPAALTLSLISIILLYFFASSLISSFENNNCLTSLFCGFFLMTMSVYFFLTSIENAQKVNSIIKTVNSYVEYAEENDLKLRGDVTDFIAYIENELPSSPKSFLELKETFKTSMDPSSVSLAKKLVDQCFPFDLSGQINSVLGSYPVDVHTFQSSFKNVLAHPDYQPSIPDCRINIALATAFN